jgi:hypothetical protein
MLSTRLLVIIVIGISSFLTILQLRECFRLTTTTTTTTTTTLESESESELLPTMTMTNITNITNTIMTNTGPGRGRGRIRGEGRGEGRGRNNDNLLLAAVVSDPQTLYYNKKVEEVEEMKNAIKTTQDVKINNDKPTTATIMSKSKSTHVNNGSSHTTKHDKKIDVDVNDNDNDIDDNDDDWFDRKRWHKQYPSNDDNKSMITPPYEQCFYIEDVCRFRSSSDSSPAEQEWVYYYDNNNNNNNNNDDDNNNNTSNADNHNNNNNNNNNTSTSTSSTRYQPELNLLFHKNALTKKKKW